MWQTPLSEDQMDTRRLCIATTSDSYHISDVLSLLSQMCWMFSLGVSPSQTSAEMNGFNITTCVFKKMCSLPFFCRYETSCTAEQIPSRLRPGGEEWPVLRWYPGLEGHMGQRLLCGQPQVCRHNYWGQWWWSFPRPPSAQGECIMCRAPFGLGWGVQMEWIECVSIFFKIFFLF